MPLYEYQCQQCGRRTEVLQKMAAAPLSTCEVCGGPLKKLASSPSVQFKGSGWYVTDYARKSGGAGAKSEGGGESKGEAAKGEGSSGAGESKPAASGDAGAASSSSAGSGSSAGASSTSSSSSGSASSSGSSSGKSE